MQSERDVAPGDRDHVPLSAFGPADLVRYHGYRLGFPAIIYSMTNLIVWRKCLMCRQSFVRGISIRGHLLCTGCERRLLNLTCDDPAYDSFRLGLKPMTNLLALPGVPWSRGKQAGPAGLPACPGHGRIRVGR
ncbi:MAG TPA: sigma factor G inhibitor Gin [Spirochaetia bacterium]|nr:sigma factor G inhibitor Gin [Spirochaetia bacterium]